jgi:hypothetical protein
MSTVPPPIQRIDNAGEGVTLFLNATNPNNGQPILKIESGSDRGGNADIRIDSANPDIELVESDQTSPAGKFEIAVNGNRFQINSRNQDDNSFENIILVRQLRTGGEVGIGVNPHTKLHVRGPIATAIASKQSDHALTERHEENSTIVANAVAGPVAITLPDATVTLGRQYAIKRINPGGNAVTLAGTRSQTIDGAAAKVLNAQWSAITVQSDGAGWLVLHQIGDVT